MIETGKGFPINPDWAKTGHDPVTNPAHYTQFPVEPIEILEHLAYNRGAACKYLIRAGLKDPSKELEDLEKAAWYVQREIARVEKERDGETEKSLEERRFTAGHLRDGKLRMWDVTNGEWVTFDVKRGLS